MIRSSHLMLLASFLGIVTGRVNPHGLRVGYRRVRVRVDLLLPGQNPTRFAGTTGIERIELLDLASCHLSPPSLGSPKRRPCHSVHSPCLNRCHKAHKCHSSQPGCPCTLCTLCLGRRTRAHSCRHPACVSFVASPPDMPDTPLEIDTAPSSDKPSPMLPSLITAVFPSPALRPPILPAARPSCPKFQMLSLLISAFAARCPLAQSTRSNK